MTKKPQNQKPTLRKQPGITADPFTSDSISSVSLHRPRGSFSLANPWCAQQGHPATPNHSWELSSQTKSIWTVLILVIPTLLQSMMELRGYEEGSVAASMKVALC